MAPYGANRSAGDPWLAQHPEGPAGVMLVLGHMGGCWDRQPPWHSSQPHGAISLLLPHDLGHVNPAGSPWGTRHKHSPSLFQPHTRSPALRLQRLPISAPPDPVRAPPPLRPAPPYPCPAARGAPAAAGPGSPGGAAGLRPPAGNRGRDRAPAGSAGDPSGLRSCPVCRRHFPTCVTRSQSA